MKSSYSKCVLVWVDDNFIHNKYLNENEDVDKWNEIFGSISKKIYRLLDLELKIITTKSDFDTYLKNIENTLDIYYYFILDLSVPESVDSEPEVINGLDMGIDLKNKNYDFCYLSSNSSAGNEMQENGLGTVDYYIKYNENILLPESLSHKILISFRNNISWINLDNLAESINASSNICSSNLLNDEDNENLSIFPYFDKFKDFVDRSELESYAFNNTMFIRSHPFDSEEFEKQSILIMMTNTIFSNPDNIVINYGYFTEKGYRNSIVNDNNNVFWFIKMSGDCSLSDFVDFYQKIIHKRVFFIIENNEDAEKFLESVDSSHTTIKDFPYINESDTNLRKELTQKTLSLLLNLKHTEDNNINFHKLYLDYPQLLLNPVNLNLMENPKFITSELSDVPEIINAIKTASDNIPISIKNILKNGVPLEETNLFKTGQEMISQENNQVLAVRILIDTLDRWLKDSWMYPYGVQIDNYHNKESVCIEWKKASFEILKMLASQLSSYSILINDLLDRKNLLKNLYDLDCYLSKNNIEQKDKLIEELNDKKLAIKDLNKKYNLENDDCDMSYLDTYNEVKLVLNVLNSNAMKDILEKESKDIDSETWEKLSYLKWPHTKYPMPWYLNFILSQSNKHLWIQHENFNFVGYSKRLINEHRKLNTMVEYYNDTLNFIEETYQSFPTKMQNFIKRMTLGIKDQNLSIDESFIEDFKNFSNCSLNISTLFGTFIQNPSDVDSDKINTNIKDLASFGTKLSYIRDVQFKNKEIFQVQKRQGYSYNKFFEDLKKNIFYLYNKTNYRKNNPFLESMYKQFSIKDLKITIQNINSKSLKEFKSVDIDEEGRFQINMIDFPDDEYNVIVQLTDSNNKKISSLSTITKDSTKPFFHGTVPLPKINCMTEIVNNLSKDKLLNKGMAFSKETNEKISDQDLYDLTVLKSNNRTVLNQMQNITSYMGGFDMYLNILKFIDMIELYEFMTDTRNKALEHQRLKINDDFLFESFIYSYESLWLQYQYVINKVEPNNSIIDIKTNYIEFNMDINNCEKDNFHIEKLLNEEIKSKKCFDSYLDNLLVNTKEEER